MSRSFAAAFLVAVLLFTSAAFISIKKGDDYVYAGGVISPARTAPSIDLTDQNGQAFTLAHELGNVVVVYFGYTTCPDLCPTTLSDFTVVKQQLGSQANRVTFLMISVDPERDTQAVLKRYLAFFDPGFIGVRGDDAQTKAVEASYGVVANRVDYPDSATKYLIDHTALIYVIDPQGRYKLAYPYGSDPDLIAKDIQHLLS